MGVHAGVRHCRPGRGPVAAGIGRAACATRTGSTAHRPLAAPGRCLAGGGAAAAGAVGEDRKSTRLNSSHLVISYAVFCLKKKKQLYRITYHVAATSLLHDRR